MSIKLINADVNDRQGTIIIEADTQEEVTGTPAKTMALRAAASHGLSRPGLSGGEGAYPVDAEGETSEDLILGRGTVAGYRCDFRVTAGL